MFHDDCSWNGVSLKAMLERQWETEQRDLDKNRDPDSNMATGASHLSHTYTFTLTLALTIHIYIASMHCFLCERA